MVGKITENNYHVTIDLFRIFRCSFTSLFHNLNLSRCEVECVHIRRDHSHVCHYRMNIKRIVYWSKSGYILKVPKLRCLCLMFRVVSASHLTAHIANGLANVSFLIEYLRKLFRLLQVYIFVESYLLLKRKGLWRLVR